MKLSVKTKMGYGISSIADHGLFYLYGTFFMFFLTTVAGITPGVAGVIAAVGAIWDAMVAPIAGYISDNTHTKHGKRKPFIMLMAFPMAVVTSMLFTAIDAGMTVKIVYYTAMTMLYWTIFPTFFIPLLAWGAELTEDYTERTALRSYAYVGNTLGLAVGTLLPTIIVDYLMNIGKNQEAAWQGTMIMISVCTFISLFFGPMLIKDKSNALTREEKLQKRQERKASGDRGAFGEVFKMFHAFGEVLKIRSLRYVIFASNFYLIASTIFASDRMYFFTYNMELSAEKTTLLLAIVTFAGIVFIPYITATRSHIDKKMQFIIGMGICGIVMVTFRFIGVTGLPAAIIVMAAFGLGDMCYWQLVPAMIYDVCEADTLVSGKERQGTIVSLQSLSESVSEAIGMLTLGFILERAGFNAELAGQTETALTWVSNCFTLLPAAFMFLAVWMIWKYPITKANFTRILGALEDKKLGRSVDLREFDGIL